MPIEMEDNLQKVTLDTNIIISALIFGGNSKEIIEKINKREFKVYISSQLVSELIEVLIKKFNFSSKMIMLLEAQIITLFNVVYPRQNIDVARDEDDNRVLEVAIESNSSIIVTGDKDLLDLKKYKNIKIMNPKDFLDSLKKDF